MINNTQDIINNIFSNITETVNGTTTKSSIECTDENFWFAFGTGMTFMLYIYISCKILVSTSICKCIRKCTGCSRTHSEIDENHVHEV